MDVVPTGEMTIPPQYATMGDVQPIRIEHPFQDRLSMFRQDALRRVSFAYLAWLIMSAVAAVAIFFIWRDTLLVSIAPSLMLYYLILGIHIAYRMQHGGRANIMAPDFVFLLFYTLFHLGYVTLYALQLIPYFDEVFFFDVAVPHSLLAVNIGLIGFLFGYEILGLWTNPRDCFTPRQIPNDIWCRFGTVLLAIALITHLGILANLSLGYLQKYGYSGLQNIGELKGYVWGLFWALSGMLTILGATIHLISSSLRYNKLFQSKLAMAIVITFLVINVLEGDRGPILMLSIPLLLVRHYFIERIRIRHLIVLGLSMAFLFSAISVVRTIVFNPSKMLAEFQYQRSAGTVTWMKPFLETGGSFLTLNITCHEVPLQEPYWMGASWGASAIHVIPFLQKFSANHGWIRWSPSDWVTITYFGRNAAGRGFTVAAEGYLNFGFAGAFAELFMFGLFIRWLTVTFSKRPSAEWAFIFLGCYGQSILVIRNHLNAISNLMAFVIVLGIVLKLFLGSETKASSMIDRRQSYQ